MTDGSGERTMGARALDDAEFAALMTYCPSASNAKHIAVGVSGGGDSMALTLLADGWARARGIELTALTVDHGLRDESAAEASGVADWLRRRGISHRTLRVAKARPSVGVQKQARSWRLAAFGAWSRNNDASCVLLAHNAEDQAETLWLRILADSGPDGLAAMRAETQVSGLRIARPLLMIPKHRLIATCQSLGQDWIEDPSNRNVRFARVRLRDQAGALERRGLGIARAQSITHGMGVARDEMDRHCAKFMTDHGGVLALGVAWFERDAFASQPAMFAELLLSRLTLAIGGGALPPRRARVARLAAALRSTSSSVNRTLAGCMISRTRDDRVWIFREPAVCAGPMALRPGCKARWDNRFEVHWRGSTGGIVGPLCEDGWRWIKLNGGKTGADHRLDTLPHGARLSVPVIRHLDGSVSVPHFVAGDGVKRATFDLPLAIGFYPDAQWIGSLITLENAG